MSIFKKNNKNHLDKKLFFDESVDVARYDMVKYPFIEGLTEKQLSFFWLPQEIDCNRDGKDFKQLSDVEKNVFKNNLMRQIMLDSIQGRAPSEAFLPISSLPELEVWIQTWAFSETIHSRSYTHIIRNVFNNPSEIFDDILKNEEVMNCAKDISKYYDDLIQYGNLVTAYGYGAEIDIPQKEDNENNEN